MSVLRAERECFKKVKLFISHSWKKNEPQLVLPEEKKTCINNLEIYTGDFIKKKLSYCVEWKGTKQEARLLSQI